MTRASIVLLALIAVPVHCHCAAVGRDAAAPTSSTVAQRASHQTSSAATASTDRRPGTRCRTAAAGAAAAISQSREQRHAVVAPRARRVPRACRRIRGSGFIARPRRLLCAQPRRFNATVTARRACRFRPSAGRARREEDGRPDDGAPFRGPFDLRMAFADVGDAKAPVARALGRQELAFGEQRLVGHLTGSTPARSFDAARVILRVEGVSGRRRSARRSSAFLPDEFDKSGNGNRFAGAYVHARRS